MAGATEQAPELTDSLAAVDLTEPLAELLHQQGRDEAVVAQSHNRAAKPVDVARKYFRRPAQYICGASIKHDTSPCQLPLWLPLYPLRSRPFAPALPMPISWCSATATATCITMCFCRRHSNEVYAYEDAVNELVRNKPWRWAAPSPPSTASASLNHCRCGHHHQQGEQPEGVFPCHGMEQPGCCVDNTRRVDARDHDEQATTAAGCRSPALPSTCRSITDPARRRAPRQTGTAPCTQASLRSSYTVCAARRAPGSRCRNEQTHRQQIRAVGTSSSTSVSTRRR